MDGMVDNARRSYFTKDGPRSLARGGAVQLACACRCGGPACVDLCHKPARPAASATTTLHLRHAFAGIPLVEGLVNLRELPPRSRFFAPFYRFAGIDSAPARAFALIEPSSL